MKKRIALGAVLLLVVVGGCAGHQRRTYRTASHHRAISAALCGFHAWRTAKDLQHGAYTFAAFQAWRTAHNCSRLGNGRLR